MIATFEDGIKKTYTIKCIEKLKEEFRIKNKTDKVIAMLGRDESYERYCIELEKIKDVGEKIRLCKEWRDRGEGPWHPAPYEKSITKSLDSGSKSVGENGL